MLKNITSAAMNFKGLVAEVNSDDEVSSEGSGTDSK
jgi:hypothetical protein